MMFSGTFSLNREKNNPAFQTMREFVSFEASRNS